ncbi:MAG TPA: RNA polymerase factor sigma-54, partial [Telluria sp.]|nr:RNA polymerase factor sigma-54 [Telluria sp.]
MKQSLQLRTSQHLALTPQLQQSIRLLQLSTLELHQEIEQILIDNPLLERLDDPLDQSVRLLADGAIASTPSAEAPQATAENTAETPQETQESVDEPTIAEGVDTDEWGEGARSREGEDEDGRPQLEASATTLREHLLEQMRLTVHEPRDRALTELLIDDLDENGYLEETLEDIHARIPPELDVEIEELRTALALLQSFEPAGVGARCAAECLALQIKRLPGVAMVTRRMALRIVEQHLAWFAQRDFNKLKKALDCDDEDLREAQAVIRQCNPHPGAAFGSGASDYVVPDVIVRRGKNGWTVSLNPDVMPKLRVNQM